MKKKKTYDKIVNIDLEIHKNATSDELERYDGVLPIITYQMFKNEIGTWGGRETCMSEPEDGFVRTNYWYVLESGLEKAKQEIERIVKNFNLQNFTNLKIGNPIDSETDYKTKFKKSKSLDWSWSK